MHWIVIVQIILSFLYVGYLVYSYSLATVGPFVKISVYLTWLICFSNVILLPYDVYFSLNEDYQLMIVWTVSYALIFFLTWILLPIAQQYQQAGQFSIKDKLKRAIINNLIIYGVFILVGLVGLGYLLISHSVDFKNLPPVMLAASNAFGMFLVVIFLSYGLTAIPRQLWRNKNYKLKLKKLQFDTSNLMRKKTTILEELQLRVKQIFWKIQRDGQTIQTTQILNLVPHNYIEKWNKKIPDLGQVNVVKLNKQIKNLILQLNRLESRWQQITISAFKIEDIMTYINSPQRRIQSTIFPHYKYQFLNYFQWLWHCRIKRIIVPAFAIILTIFAITIVVAELTVFIQPIKFINPFSKLTNISQFVWLDLVQLCILGYMAFCIYYALFKLKFSNYYGLYWNKQTDAASLIFFAINCSRITNPLNYNFLQIINDDDTSFVKAMGSTPLIGKTLQIIFPVLIIILIIFNAFDAYTNFNFNSNILTKTYNKEENFFKKQEQTYKPKYQTATVRIYHSSAVTNLNFQGPQISTTEEITSKESISSDAISIKPKFFNEYQNMEQVIKIFNM